jgi:anhydro-N-acetylmuramic acid kinase
MAHSLFIGLMSGTSADGVDAVLSRIDEGGEWLGVQAHAHRPFEASLRSALVALNTPGPDEIERAARAAHALSLAYAQAVQAVLAEGGVGAGDVAALGAHGQTVRHRPGAFGDTGYTVQLLHPATLAEACGIDVVADLRSRDMAAGGQGAPLVPAFHQAVFGRPDAAVAVVNIGGISNISVLDPSQPVLGFDCGPGNALMDEWAQQHLGQPYDAEGAWAGSGHVLPALLVALQDDDYFTRRPPKSTGRDHFHAAWLASHLARHAAGASPADVQATLCELTAACIADDVRRHAPAAVEVVVCGGGAFNDCLMQRLCSRLGPACAVVASDRRGLPPLQVEGAAFAWLAWAHLARRPGNLPDVTGAAGLRVLGAMYPAGPR